MRRHRGFAFLALGLALAVPSLANAASVPLILRGGLSIAKVDFSGGTEGQFEPDHKLGFAGSVAAQFALTPAIAVAPELGYAMRGFSYGKSEGTDTSGNLTGTFETLDATDVVTLAVPLRVSVPAAGRIRVAITTGPEVAFEARERFVLTGSTQSSQKTDLLRNTDFGVMGGVGADVAAGPGRLSVEGRYVHGLAQLARNDSAVDIHSRVYEIVTGYTFRLGW